jgi:hypothetical protein
MERDKLKEHAKRMSDALISVRPLGGSELFVQVDGEFYADPDWCGAAIKKLRDDLHEARIEIARLRREAA